MKNPGIYILTSPSGKSYVGVDSDLPRRPRRHLSGDNKATPLIHAALQKYGADTFTVEIIEYTGISRESLSAIEQWKISQLNTLAPNGYNFTTGGGPLTEEHKRKISEAQQGEKNHFYRKTHADDFKSKNSKRMKGKNNPMKRPEVRQKNRESQLFDEEYRRRHSEANTGAKNPFYGKTHTEATRRKISKARSAYWDTKRKKAKWMYILSFAQVFYESSNTPINQPTQTTLFD